jgi:2-oxoglutarate ferredoxin oxidoreductase subunit beta
MSDVNELGLSRPEYVGSKSTLCVGCGHDSVTGHIITSFFQSSIDMYGVTKLSGIGCSSKTPAYMFNKSHGFNSIHGRMAPVATGVHLAHSGQRLLGVSGDGDTASIGLGSFAHMVRRNIPMIYIVENNGVYGLTKGQFSATADEGTRTKHGGTNSFSSIDLCSMAIDLGCTFVARSFSGDAKQLVPLLNAALRHPGTVLIDIISPCVTFANHEGSTRSFESVKSNNVHLQELGFIQPRQEVKVDYQEGTTQQVKMHDGSILTLRKLLAAEHDITRSDLAMARLQESRARGEFLTGLFVCKPERPTLADSLGLVEAPLRDLDKSTRPSASALKEMLDVYA